MKFSAILATVALGAVSQVVYAAPAELETRDVWDPRMTYPTKGTVWESGKTYTVKWETKDAPVNITGGGNDGRITLRSGDFETPILLAWNVHLRDGHAKVKVPEVYTASDYSLVLWGDSGNWGQQFTIKGPLH